MVVLSGLPRQSLALNELKQNGIPLCNRCELPQCYYISPPEAARRSPRNSELIVAVPPHAGVELGLLFIYTLSV